MMVYLKRKNKEKKRKNSDQIHVAIACQVRSIRSNVYGSQYLKYWLARCVVVPLRTGSCHPEDKYLSKAAVKPGLAGDAE